MHKIVKELEEGGATEKWCEEVRRAPEECKAIPEDRVWDALSGRW